MGSTTSQTAFDTAAHDSKTATMASRELDQNLMKVIESLPSPFRQDDEFSDSESNSGASLVSGLPGISHTPAMSEETQLTTTIASTPPAPTSNLLSTVNDMKRFVGLQTTSSAEQTGAKALLRNVEAHRTAPIFTSDVAECLESNISSIQGLSSSFTQFGLIGTRETMSNDGDDQESDKHHSKSLEDNLVIANMDMPFSTFICGSQGAGKSHTLSCLLENALLKDNEVGCLPSPLAAMVFHYDNYTSSSCGQICEAAYLCSSGVPVTVLVSPSNIWAMTELYSNLPGLPAGAPKPRVLPLYLSESLLDITTMLKLMAIDPSSDNIPLYMGTVMSILREMAMEGKGTGAFSYAEFRARLEHVDWIQGQLVPLSLRLQLLDSFLEPSQFTRSTRPAPAKENIWAFEPGTMTIVDLSDSFVNSNDACSLFSICLSLFLEDRGKCGRVVALDEAHKFLLQTGAAQALTADLTSIIRQQRHTGTRVIVATQEPTLSPDIIDLANVTFVHRFLSPAWYETLKKHLAGAHKHESDDHKVSLFETIVGLETGQALLFCPTALVSVDETSDGDFHQIHPLSNNYLKVRIRNRLTADGGKSILASETTAASAAGNTQDIPMHIVRRAEAIRSKAKKNALVTQLLGPVRIDDSTAPAQSALPTDAAVAAPPRFQHLAPAVTPSQQSVNGLANTTVADAVASASSTTAQSAPNGTDRQFLRRLEAETRAQIAMRCREPGWKRRNDPNWNQIGKSVEKALSLKARTVCQDPKTFQHMINYAKQELKKQNIAKTSSAKST